MKYEFKGSPAPWAAKDPLRYTSEAPSVNSVDIYSKYDGDNWKWVCNAHGENVRIPSQEMVANAHLIAAAPQLLQACIEALDMVNKERQEAGSAYYDRIFDQLHKAIHSVLNIEK